MQIEKIWEIIDLDNPAKTLSTLISGAIVAGSFALKLPQIFRIVKSGNAAGVSLAGNLVEGVGFAISASWGWSQNLPFKAYGESTIILAQVAILCLLIGGYNGFKTLMVAVFGLMFIGALGATLAFTTQVPVAIHEYLMGVQILFVAFSRLPQIVMNQKNKSTGALSFATFFLSFGGAGARAFTNLVSVPWEKGKLVMFATAMVSCALNAIIVLQIYVYKQRKQKIEDEENGGTRTTKSGISRVSKNTKTGVAAAAAAGSSPNGGRSSRQTRKTV